MSDPWLSLSRRVCALRELDSIDQAIYRAIAATPSPTLDAGLGRLSSAADHSKLWLALAGVLALPDGRPRRAAVSGVVSLGLASGVVNIAAKRVLTRARPDRVAAAVPVARQVRMPASGSFPSGHSASAFAFATAVGQELPLTSFPLYLLAAGVAYSRVHTGVHYPTDTIIGALIGAASAVAVRYAAASLCARRMRSENRGRPHGSRLNQTSETVAPATMSTLHRSRQCGGSTCQSLRSRYRTASGRHAPSAT